MIYYVVHNIRGQVVYGFSRFFDKKPGQSGNACYRMLFAFALPQNKNLCPFQLKSFAG